MTFGCPMVSDVRAGKVFRIDLDGKVTVVADVPSRPFGLGVLPDGDLLGATMTQRLIVKFGAEKPAVPDQRVASMAACAFAPKLATQTLNNADHNMGPAAWEPRCQSIETRMAGRLQGKRCASDGRKKETDGKRTSCSIRLGGRHEARCVPDLRARQRNVAVPCQSHSRS